MKDNKPTADDVVLATQTDLDQLLEWLEREFYEDEEQGFWHNRRMLPKALESGDLFVIRDNGEAIAFQLGQHAADISNVRKDLQRQGFGTALLEASILRAYRDNVNVLEGECFPRTSVTFWQKHGFERYGDMSDWGKITVRRILDRSFELPPDLPRVPVTITFYPERIIYSRDEPVAPLATHDVTAVRLEDGRLKLDRRVIGLTDTGPDGGDLAVKIEIEGNTRCLGKAKHQAATQAGMVWDWRGGAFYIDAIVPVDTAECADA